VGAWAGVVGRRNWCGPFFSDPVEPNAPVEMLQLVST
jgi:hypothetical protein